MRNFIKNLNALTIALAVACITLKGGAMLHIHGVLFATSALMLGAGVGLWVRRQSMRALEAGSNFAVIASIITDMVD